MRLTYTLRNGSRIPKLWLEIHNPTTLPGGLPGRAVTLAGRTRRISFASALADLAVHGLVDGASFRAEIERTGLALRVAQDGARVDVRVLTPRAAELLALMPFKPPPDLSRFLLSPMPGLLVNIAVAAGQAVRTGERLAVIEAMKMENILTATQDGTVGELLAKQF